MILLATTLTLLAGSPQAAEPPPRLVVFLAIDQLRPDYLDRFGDQWTGGFRRMLDQAAYFPNGQQDHAFTETAPGHASFLSGRFPVHTGVLKNSLGVQDANAPVIGVSGAGASPRRFQGTTLYDWILNRDSAARVLSVSRKDRGAIFTVGRAMGQVYWYAGGRFTTSRYYAVALPDWIIEYNARRGPQRMAGTIWTPLLPSDRYPEADTMGFENGGVDLTFPHTMHRHPDTAAMNLPSSPWMDSLTLDLALAGATALQLGHREGTDLLSISLSTTDAVGHAFGPDSREVHDMLLRLDRWLGWFMDSLAVLVPEDQIVFALSADHGVQSFPELTVGVHRQQGGRVWLGDLAREPEIRLGGRHRVDFDFDFEGGLLTANLSALRARGIDVDSLADTLANEARGRRGVARVFTRASLRAAPQSDRDARLWRHTLTPDGDWLFAAVVSPGFMWQSSAGSTTHGSTNLLDTTVPMAFWGRGIRPGRFARPVNTVDIGPTLAALIGVTPTEPVDGVVLPEVAATAHTQ